MLEKPNLPDAAILTCLKDAYGINAHRLDFLPLGADQHTAVYRAEDAAMAYFVKLRQRDFFDPMSLTVPRFLHDQGITQVIAPILTRAGVLWTPLESYQLSVAPFIAGRNGYEIRLTDAHWIELGRALRSAHSATIPPEIMNRARREDFSPYWRDQVRDYQRMAAARDFPDPVAAQLAALLRDQRAVIDHLVAQAEVLAAVLQKSAPPFVLCHGDLHAGNVHISDDGDLYIVDWDTVILAPAARDLMYAGGGQFGDQRTPEQEEALFYQGYGTKPENAAISLTFYKYQRIVEDIAAYCEQILLTTGDGPDRANGLRQLSGQFEPGGVIAIARRSAQFLPPALRVS